MTDNSEMKRTLMQALANSNKSEQKAVRDRLRACLDSMSEAQKNQLERVLSDETRLKAVLSTAKAQELIRKLGSG
ncbi:MAG: hypothetical protein IKS19_03205 [Clostridia bacterium]|nr:hypothetical protein [Clostridia bacterium]